MIVNKTLEEWQDEFPLIQNLINYEEIVWMNDKLASTEEILPKLSLDEADILAAEARLKRFAPYIAHVFPETIDNAGIIESPLTKISKMKKSLRAFIEAEDFGDLYLKEDNKLPISGSIKARGGIYEMLTHAENLALEANMISVNEDYKMFAHDTFKEYFSEYSIVCGSTGNLGLSIGIIGAELGFNVTIHMSDDARQWKKDLLREKGVTVVEHSDDYTKAVEEGRRQSAMNAKSHFIDDENSTTLFLGYAVAAIRLKAQLQSENILVDKDHPLHVYLPCGVGGGPGGVAFGLKTVFGNNVHCYFAEPTHSPSMLLGMMTDYHEELAVQDFGIDNVTAADGLAVGRPSGFVGQFLRELITGAYTVTDENLFKMLTLMYDSEEIKLEPSALAGIIGPVMTKSKGTHIAWSTGGDMVPEEVWEEYYQTGKNMM